VKMKIGAVTFLAALLVTGLGAALSTGGGTAEAAKAPKVWICHFSGHDHDGAPFAGNFALDGDYVINNPGDAGPGANQIAFCDTAGGTVDPGEGGSLIHVNANSLDGHGAQLQGRVAQY